MSVMQRDELAGRLRDWARGSSPMTAGVELLLRAFDGRFAHPSRPWLVAEPDGRVWVDPAALRDCSGVLSGGERRVIATVAALIDEAPIDIVDIVTGLDRTNLHLVLAALAHAAGSHGGANLVIGPDRLGHPIRLGPVVVWPPSH